MYRILALLLLAAPSLSAQSFNRPVPPDFPNIQFSISELAFEGHYCANSYQLNPATKTNMFLLDAEGYVAWWRKDQTEVSNDFKYHPGVDAFTSMGYRDEVGGVFYTYDTEFNAVDTLEAANGERGDRHEFLLLENGHKIIGTLYDTIMNLSAYIFNGITGLPNSTVRGFGIQEFDAENNLVWTWHSTDFVHPVEFSDGLNYNANSFDYAHGNSIDLDQDGNLIVSLRNTSTVCKIDRVNRTGNILWRLGGEESSFLMVDDEYFNAQHYARVLPNGHIGMYDNGNLRWPGRYSRAAEYELNPVAETAELVWEYDADRNIFASAIGNAQWINDDLILIGWGYVFRPDPTFSLVDRAGNVLSSLYFEDGYVSYRIQATELPFDLPRPTLTYEVHGETVTLHAPEGYEEYVWSTGETTSSITIATNGTYQVWVPHGIGMVGSYPVHVDELVGLDDLALAQLNVFPNPVLDELQIRAHLSEASSFSVALYNASGRLMQELKGQGREIVATLETAAYPPGIYLLQLSTPAGMVNQRIVIQ